MSNKYFIKYGKEPVKEVHWKSYVRLLYQHFHSCDIVEEALDEIVQYIKTYGGHSFKAFPPSGTIQGWYGNEQSTYDSVTNELRKKQTV